MSSNGKFGLCGLISSGAISTLGNSISYIALPWFVLANGGGPMGMGLVIIISAIGVALGAVIGGTFADRVGFKKACIISDLISCVAVAAIPISYMMGVLSFPWLLSLTFAGALLDPSGAIARSSLVIPASQASGTTLDRGNSLLEGAQGVANVVGPAMAGILVSLFGPMNALWATAITFVISATLITVSGLKAPSAAEGKQGVGLKELMQGFHHLRKDRTMYWLLKIDTMTLFILMPFLAVIVPVLINVRYQDALVLGIFMSCEGVGVILGALLYGWYGANRRKVLIVISYISMTAVIGAMLFVYDPPSLYALSFMLGLSFGPLNPMVSTIIQERTPLAMLGRVKGIYIGLAFTAIPIGSAIMTGVMQFGLDWAMIATSLSMMLLLMAVLSSSALKGMDQAAADRQGSR